METKRFHLGDILTITTGRLIANEHMDAVYKILGYMTGEELFTHQLPRASKQCRPWLSAQFPQLATDELKAEVVLMCDSIPPNADKATGARIIGDWLATAVERFGEWHEVAKAPATADGPRDPIQEAVEIFGADRVVVVQAPSPPPEQP